MERKIGRSCLLLASACLLVLLIPLPLVAHWTLFLQIDDSATHRATARLLAAAETSGQPPRLPIIVVYGLLDGDADLASSCATDAGPFAYETLLTVGRYIPLHSIGPWLIEDGYAPYDVILATAPEYTPTVEENGRCLEAQRHNLVARLGDRAPEKFTIIARLPSTLSPTNTRSAVALAMPIPKRPRPVRSVKRMPAFGMRWAKLPNALRSVAPRPIQPRRCCAWGRKLLISKVIPKK